MQTQAFRHGSGNVRSICFVVAVVVVAAKTNRRQQFRVALFSHSASVCVCGYLESIESNTYFTNWNALATNDKSTICKISPMCVCRNLETAYVVYRMGEWKREWSKKNALALFGVLEAFQCDIASTTRNRRWTGWHFQSELSHNDDIQRVPLQILCTAEI